MIRRLALFLVGISLLVALHGPRAAAQPPPTPTEPPIEKLGEHLLRVGNIRIDLKKREITVPGVVTRAMALEFVATTKGGFKSYESALELDTSATGFNLALILIGLDKTRAVPARHHFDPRPPEGDLVETWVIWEEEGATRKVRGEELVYDAQKKETLPQGPWVYTGSVFTRDGRYLAELHGVLISFVHTPAAIIENPLPHGVGRYGSLRLNPDLNLKPGTPVLLTVTALPQR